MNGPDCPRCDRSTLLGSTTNDYPYECTVCGIRFNNTGDVMAEDWRYTSGPRYDCTICDWSVPTAQDQDSAMELTPWQQYRIHLFLKHNTPLPDSIQQDVNGVMIDGE